MISTPYTSIYFIRHAQADNSVHDSPNRPLTAKGMADCALVTEFLWDKDIEAVLSSTYKRAVDTVADFADKKGLAVETVAGFHEQVFSRWLEETAFWSFVERQWQDFSYTEPGLESLAAVMERNIATLEGVLEKYRGRTIAIGTHGVALSMIIRHFDPTYGHEDFMAMVDLLPWVVRADFNDNGCMGMKKIDLFNPGQAADYSKCVVRCYDLDVLKAYRFVVIFARHQDKWLYCRAKERAGFETAGGHIEPGESPMEAARRELHEETGALRFDMVPVFDYSVHIPTGYSNGQVFLADIHELGFLPAFEMAETALFDDIPAKMRFPGILPLLYERIRTISVKLKRKRTLPILLE